MTPALDLSAKARAARTHARYRALRYARRAAWRAAHGDPALYRRVMAAWIAAGRPGPVTDAAAPHPAPPRRPGPATAAPSAATR